MVCGRHCQTPGYQLAQGCLQMTLAKFEPVTWQPHKSSILPLDHLHHHASISDQCREASWCDVSKMRRDRPRFPEQPLSPIHTADADETKLPSCVMLAVWTHPSAVVTQFTISCADKWRHNDVIVEKVLKNSRILHYTADSNVYKHAASYVTSYPTIDTIGCRIVNLVMADGCVHIAESVGSCRELVANSCTHRRRDATRQFRCVGIGSVYWALGSLQNEPSWILANYSRWTNASTETVR